MKRVASALVLLALATGSVRSFAADAPDMAFDGAKWIWAPPGTNAAAGGPPEGAVQFRASFAIPENVLVTGAEVAVTADNLFTLHLDGQTVGESDANPDAWASPRRFDVAHMLTPGGHVFAVEAMNTAPGPAGLLFRFVARLSDGQSVIVVSDASWKCSEADPPNWVQPTFDDQGWGAARVVAEFGGGPWGRLAAGSDRRRGGTKEAMAELPAPAGFVWPGAIVFCMDDCSLERPRSGTGTSADSLSVTVFNPRNSRAFPEHDLPAPMKVAHRLCAIDAAATGATPRVLLDAGAGAVGSPSVSFDGASVLVTMAREGDGFYHLYRIPAKGGAPVRLTDGPFHDIDPAELPDGRIVFTSTRIGTFEEYHNPPSRSLFVMDADGRRIRPLTHTFVFDNEPEVMADGRIVFIRSDNFFDRGKVETMLHAIHPDGSGGYTEFGLDLGPDYGGRLRAFNCGSPAPMPDGRIAFVSAPGITVGRAGSASEHQRHLNVQAGDVAALPDGRLLCTTARRTSYAKMVRKQKRIMQEFSYEKICVVDPDAANPQPVLVFDSAGVPLHSPVFLGARTRPRAVADKMDARLEGHPAATGILYCRDARLTKNTTAGWPHVRAIRVLAGHGLTMRSSHSYIVHAGSEVDDLGTVPLAPDGSFSVEVPADTAIAFQAVDGEGHSELNEMSWIFVRPGERRGCVGCHAPRQTAPPAQARPMLASTVAPLRLILDGEAHRFRGNNAAVTGLMELQFDRYREVAGINRHASANPLATGADEVAALCGRMALASPGERRFAAQRLGVFRSPAAAPGLAKLLGDTNREVRVSAAVALGPCGTRDSVEPLCGALADRDPLVAQAAAMALGHLTGRDLAFDGFASPADRAAAAAVRRAEFVSPGWAGIEAGLAQRLAGKDRDDVRRAAEALGHIGGPSCAAALRERLSIDRQTNPLPEWRPHHGGDAARFNSLDAVNPRSIQAVTRALGGVRDADAIPLLSSTLESNADPAAGNLFLAEAAVDALGRIGTPAALDELERVFAGLKDYWLHSGWYGDHGALIACHSSPVHYRILEALDAAGVAASNIVTQIVRSIPTDPDRALLPGSDDYESLAGRTIRRAGAAPAVLETCLSVLGDPTAKASPEIVTALRTVHTAWAGTPDASNRAAQVISAVCRDRAWEPRVRAAFERFAEATNDIPRVFDHGIPVVQKLPVRHWICFYLARALGEMGDPRSADAMLAALEKHPAEGASGQPDPLGPGVLFLHNDLTPCWRAEAAWALGRIGDRRAGPALLAAAGNMTNAPDTRIAAAMSLKRLDDPALAGAIAELAERHPEVSVRRILMEIAGAPPVRLAGGAAR